MNPYESGLRIKASFRLYRPVRKFANYTGYAVKCLSRLFVNVTLGASSKLLKFYVITEYAHQIDFHRIFLKVEAILNVISSNLLSQYEDVHLLTLLQ